MKLHYRLTETHLENPSSTIILLHGLFGNLDNLGVLARDLQHYYPVLQVDLRNHGLSSHSTEMNYQAMSQDLLELIQQLSLEKVIVIGHSMGGKVAMALSAIAPEKIEKLVIIDIAPVDYQVRRHDKIFTALQAVSDAKVTQRHEAAGIMRNTIQDEGVIQFLLKSFHQGEWRFNVPVLLEQYTNILGWQSVPAWPHPVLFISGGNSPYVQAQYRTTIAQQFPKAKAHVIAGCGHWVHSEKPELVLRTIHRFLGIQEKPATK